MKELAHRYDGFILDQFGVMHNGKESLPGAVECVQTLSSSLGKKLIILSNTSSPSEAALAKLPKLGFDPKCFVGAVTSGEEASRFIRERYGGDTNDTNNPKRKAILLTWADELSSRKFLKKCGNIEATVNYDEADLVIAHGSQVMRGQKETSTSDEKISECSCSDISLGSFMDSGDLSFIEPILEKCKEHNLEMVCANPDFVVKAGGSFAHMPGKIAEKYEEMGGVCKYFGKPHEEHFNACLQELGLDAHRVAHVGDSLHHDIAGANAANIPNIFITGGIHSEALDQPIGNADFVPSIQSLESLFDVNGSHVPTHVMPLFKF